MREQSERAPCTIYYYNNMIVQFCMHACMEGHYPYFRLVGEHVPSASATYDRSIIKFYPVSMCKG